MNHPLDKIFKAQTIAVIGASNEKGSVGFSLIQNLIGNDYKGIVYPINPNHRSIQGIKCYSNISEIGDFIDLSVIATPPKTVPKIVNECGENGVKGIVIISAGFREVGEGGNVLCNEILHSAKKFNIRIIGPNCLGFINPLMNLNASFANRSALPGHIAFISQSGALCTAILDWAVEKNVGFSNFVSIGSMIDVGFHDLIDYFGSDPNTSSILLYMESLSHARKFMGAARAFARNKPIIVLKAGKSSEGAKAALSHTGTLAGNDKVFDAAFKRAGAIRVDTIDQLFNLAQVLAMQERPKGNRLAIVTNAGGPAVLATDRLIGSGGKLASLTETTLNTLNTFLPPAWSKGNPVDILGDANVEKYKKAVETCVHDENVDGVLVILTPQDITDPEKVAIAMVDLRAKINKTLLSCWMGEQQVKTGRDILENGKIPVFTTPEQAVDCFQKMYEYASNIELLYETPATIPSAFSPETSRNKELIKEIANQGRYVLTEYETKKLLLNYDIPVGNHRLASSLEQAQKMASEIGFPVAMKISSPDILHKTDVGGVKLRLGSESEVRDAYLDMLDNVQKHQPDAIIQGVIIEQMQSRKYELLIGAKKDPIFGPVIVFGMGGVAVEVFKDMNVGLPPLNMALALRLIEETKIYKLLKGYRGMSGADIRSIQFLLYKFAYLVIDFPEILEIDINPFAVDELGGVVLDAKVVLDENIVKTDFKPYSHLVISPYPKQYITTFEMTNGQQATLRPIRPEDEPLEAEMFTKFSESTQYFRFFHLIKSITHDLLVRFTHNDYDREIAIIAEVVENNKRMMAGVVRLVADAFNETAEFAIVVADPWHGLGLGNKLTDYILEIARERRIKKVYATLLMKNKVMLHMFRERGFTIRDDMESGTFSAEWDIE